jgi:hypothetical protein
MSTLSSYWHNKVFSQAGGASTLSDIRFLTVKEFDNKLINLNGTADVTTTGVKLTRTIPNGEKFYFAKAKIVPMNTPVVGASEIWRATVAIKFDGTIVDTVGYTGYTEEGTQAKNLEWDLPVQEWNPISLESHLLAMVSRK